MQLSVKIHFGPNEETSEATIAITPEQARLSLEEFSKIIYPAIALIHHNTQAFMQLCEDGTISPRPKGFYAMDTASETLPAQ